METNNEARLTAAYNIYLKFFPPDDNIGDKPEKWGIPVVIGGFAVLLQGGPRTDTPDLDLAVTCSSYAIETVVKTEIKNDPKGIFSRVKGKGTEPDKWFISIDDKMPPFQFDWVPVGGDFVNKSLQSVRIDGVDCASVPDLVFMKAKAIVPGDKRTLQQRANHAKDLGFPLQKMVDAGEKIPDRLNTGPNRWNLEKAPEFTPDIPGEAHTKKLLEELVAKVLLARAGSD